MLCTFHMQEELYTFTNPFKAVVPRAEGGGILSGHYGHSEAFLWYSIAFCGLINLNSIIIIF